MAMFTKEMTITLPFMVLFYEACFLKTEESFNWKPALVSSFFPYYIDYPHYDVFD